MIRRPFRLTRRGQLAFVGPGGQMAISRPRVDPALSTALIRAEAWKRKLLAGQSSTIEAIAKEEGLNSTYAARLIRIAFLAPDLKKAILDGTTSETFTLEMLMKHDVPLAWDEQRALYAA